MTTYTIMSEADFITKDDTEYEATGKGIYPDHDSWVTGEGQSIFKSVRGIKRSISMTFRNYSEYAESVVIVKMDDGRVYGYVKTNIA